MKKFQFLQTIGILIRFSKNPPAGTCLFGKIIPSKGGDTLFSNQHLALERMPSELRKSWR